jgi:erythronate-4-phosphate dehydrogenase
MRIVADKQIPFISTMLEKVSWVDFYNPQDITPAVVKDADALIVRTRTQCGEALLGRSGVRMVVSATAGYDHLDTEYLQRKGIEWAYAPGCNASSVVQYVLTALVRAVHLRDWSVSQLTLGIVGVGHVGSLLATCARSLGMQVLLCDPPRASAEGASGFCSYETVLQACDCISFHVPLTYEGPYSTYHLCNEECMSRMKPGALLINTSRGEVVDTKALKLLLGGRIGGAILDVWENEPLVDRELLCMVEIGTAHIAGYAYDAKYKASQMITQALGQFFGQNFLEFFPALQPPEHGQIDLRAMGNHSLQGVLQHVFTRVYDIMADDALMRGAQNMELLRNHYGMRRDFCAYTLVNIPHAAWVPIFRSLGFNTPA